MPEEPQYLPDSYTQLDCISEYSYSSSEEEEIDTTQVLILTIPLVARMAGKMVMMLLLRQLCTYFNL